jgi:hypothetical protein
MLTLAGFQCVDVWVVALVRQSQPTLARSFSLTWPVGLMLTMGDAMQEYLIRRGGGFYRPKAAGYTQSIAEAGRWSKEDAYAYQTGVEGVTVHHISEYPAARVTEDEITRLLDEAWPDGHRAMARRILERYSLLKNDT